MGCNSCSTDGTPKGCKSNGSCGTGSCDKLTVFDWLANMELPTGQKPYDIVEVRFKNGRKHFYKNEKNIPLVIGDIIAVEGNPGHDIGTVSLTGELVKIQMKKKGVLEDSDEVKKIYRKASQKDIETWQEFRDKELETQTRGREIILKLGLQMKLSDVEFQGDGNKATFYYTADERVDFRQLIRDLASTFSIRVEMKQVGLRQEAARLGGIGSCGRELCCSTWLTDFRKVNTTAARYQQLSLNPLKLAGQCGKLKCCLNYELDTYLDALKKFPSQDILLKTVKGNASFIKMDIFKERLWYAYIDDKSKWFQLTLEQVVEIINENKNGVKVESLEEYDSENIVETKIEFENVVGQDSLTRFDAPKRKSSKKRPVRKSNVTTSGEAKAENNLEKTKNPKQESGSKPSQQPRKPKPKSPQQVKGDHQLTETPKNNAEVKKKKPVNQKPKTVVESNQAEGGNQKTNSNPKKKFNNRRRPRPNNPNTPKNE